ncbi:MULTISPECIES: GntR family transcriptional regulator [Microbacterium]|uniref:GntR family transcriptional regulator n=1 Tax=Microbacterium barkeri TaxID=33917 RepID=A0A9W6H4S5_9MICO|nr:GntR family transcriptional regulator [Microbacterium barkeri]MDR6875666.1 DNA-binding GntR family transcriptional regulator [Microbacterium barkeri]GLJ62298.1 GntR family transcriptional regulator [Microbacterium barkeri]
MTDTLTGLSKSQRAYEWIRERIQRHEFGPGYRLVLGSIAAALDMSVVPVREAVRRLEAEGIVEFERNVGARVTLVDETEYLHSMQTLGVVEGVATSLSAPLLDAADLDRASAINERLRRLLDDFDPHRFTVINQEFHAVLFEPCPNPHILDLVHRGWTRMAGLRDSSFAFVPGRAHESVAEHDRILELIRSGAEPLEIELAAREHRWATMNAFLAQRHAAETQTDRTKPLTEEET